MNNKYISYFKIATLSVAISLSACKKTLQIDPQDSISADQALTSKDGIDATIVSIYSSLKAEVFYGNRLVMLGDALSDNARSTNHSGRYVSEAANARLASYSHWSAAYVNLNRINLVLEALPNASSLSAAQKDAYTGELKFLRALYHFDLVKTYAYIPGALVESQNRGGIPLALKAISSSSDALQLQSARNSIAEVYTAIYADLDEAVSKLSNITSSTVVRANKQAAQALYSRVALYNKDYPKAISNASSVLEVRANTLLNANNYIAGWSQAVNPESVFEIAFLAANETLGVNLALQTNLTTLSARATNKSRDSTDKYKAGLPLKPGSGFGDLVPTSDLLTALGITVANNGAAATSLGAAATTITNRSADVRNLLYEVGSSSRTPIYVECTKYLGKSGFANVDNVPVIRVSEMYLNRAEAYANASQESLALADVNTIRVARGLPAVTGLTGSALINEILLQRRLEFAFEGQRFLDLKRLGRDILKPVTNTTIAFTDIVILPQIPVTDVNASGGKLLQNFGY
ncbi:RagB/SusD family nutrient uptake outer membrane protein [Mucilaginibacter sp. CSA2-8R]|uniref:RagB/SusD family nutrient uptake outer membrane protein n=1 Tax=Mucilaginibacter sp. CSA2-8R TaxID=3141542 RepID=UPI00315D4085